MDTPQPVVVVDLKGSSEIPETFEGVVDRDHVIAAHDVGTVKVDATTEVHVIALLLSGGQTLYIQGQQVDDNWTAERVVA